ncbi:MAG: hypothetical protein E6J02_12535 [Chloroflexi bacterium]|nr:MAG: hypothetical protein E6J02_12535 [Chloroflexota bacterium]
MGLDALDQAVDVAVAENAAHGIDADAVVGGQEIEERDLAGGQLQPGRPAGESFRIFRRQRVEDERRQREVVDELRLIGPVAEVGDIVPVGHVGLGDQEGVGRHLVE